MTAIAIDPQSWTNAVNPAQTGSQSANDITNDILNAIQSLCDALNAVGFIENYKNFIDILDDFGHGMVGALACTGADLTVVASGVHSAAIAFPALDTELASLFQQLDSQLPYLTNTTTTVTLPTPSLTEEQALADLGTTPIPGDPGYSILPPPGTSNQTAAEAAALSLLALLIFFGIFVFAP